jgi:hypothetical protein
MARADVFQIYYSDLTRAEVDPGFVPLDNMANERPDWREYWPIRNFLLNNALDPRIHYGFFSPKFRAKTGLDSAFVHDFVNRHGGHADVISFSPFFEEMALPLNIVEQAVQHHSDSIDTFSECAALIAPEFRIDQSVMTSRNTIFCNFFVAKADFWAEWLRRCEQLFEIAERADTPLAAGLNRVVSYGAWTAPAKVFVIERVASLLLWSQPRWVAMAADLPQSPAGPNPELLVLDALKQACATTGKQSYLTVYRQLRGRIAERQRVAAQSLPLPAVARSR